MLTEVIIPEVFLCSIAHADFVDLMEMFHEDFVGALALNVNATVATDTETIGNPDDGVL